MRQARWWLVTAVALGQAVMLVVTVRHSSGAPDELPGYGFPFPWTWFAGFSSLHWSVAPLAWLVDLLVHALVLAPVLLAVGAGLARLGAPAERVARRAALGAIAVALALLVAFELIPAVLGWRHLAWELRPGGPRRTIAVAPYPPL